MSDLISRQAAIEALDKRFDSIPMEQTTEILLLRKDLRNLPSAQPKTGEWEQDVDGHFFCTNCKKYPEYQVRMSDYCPNCGADMRGEEE